MRREALDTAAYRPIGGLSREGIGDEHPPVELAYCEQGGHRRYPIHPAGRTFIVGGRCDLPGVQVSEGHHRHDTITLDQVRKVAQTIKTIGGYQRTTEVLSINR